MVIVFIAYATKSIHIGDFYQRRGKYKPDIFADDIPVNVSTSLIFIELLFDIINYIFYKALKWQPLISILSHMTI